MALIWRYAVFASIALVLVGAIGALGAVSTHMTALGLVLLFFLLVFGTLGVLVLRVGYEPALCVAVVTVLSWPWLMWRDGAVGAWLLWLEGVLLLVPMLLLALRPALHFLMPWLKKGD